MQLPDDRIFVSGMISKSSLYGQSRVQKRAHALMEANLVQAPVGSTYQG